MVVILNISNCSKLYHSISVYFGLCQDDYFDYRTNMVLESNNITIYNIGTLDCWFYYHMIIQYVRPTATEEYISFLRIIYIHVQALLSFIAFIMLTSLLWHKYNTSWYISCKQNLEYLLSPSIKYIHIQ